MKTRYYFSLLFLPLALQGQVSEDFTDGDFRKNPAWTGDTALFEVNAAKELHLKSAGADTTCLSTSSARNDTTEWNFWVKLSFNTSANNFARFYIISDSPDLAGSLNGCFIQIGGSNDSLVFCRQTGTVIQTLFHGSRTCTNKSVNVLRIRIVHDPSGAWRLSSDETGGTDYQEEGSCITAGSMATSCIGVYCRYTSSNATKFYFDDIYAGPVIVDTIPPAIRSSEVLNDHNLAVLFTEPVDAAGAQLVSNYETGLNGKPVKATRDSIDPHRVMLTFSTAFTDGECDTLTTHNIKDNQGNNSGTLHSRFCLYHEKTYDVLIHEIMADPEPVTGLPASEYVELFNRTQYPIRLKDWVFEYGSASKVMPDQTIEPFGYLILLKGEGTGFTGPTMDLFTSSTSLANDGTTLVLKNKEGRIIHSVSYSGDWYRDPVKEDGGWSLEMIDPANPCGCRENWIASTDEAGGSPGKPNPVFRSNPDTTAPYIIRAVIDDPLSVRVFFRESMDSLSLVTSREWRIDPRPGVTEDVSLVPPDFSSVRLTLPEPLEDNTMYTVMPPEGLKDCSGNNIAANRVVHLAIPDSILASDIVINEILPNPATGGERFVEIFNRSGKILDLRSLVLSSYDTLAGELNDQTAITGESYLFFPGDYVVLTRDPEDIKGRYRCPDPDCFISMASMPTMSDDDGIVVIARKSDSRIVDRVRYSKDMQFALLNATDGVSLERVNAERPSDDKTNWHSASESCGYATPGYRNSQQTDPDNAGGMITLSPPVFTPDNDGLNDILTLSISPGEPGFMGSVTIYNARGVLTRQLMASKLLSTNEVISWDGADNNGEKAPVGIYFLFIELLKPDGTVKQYKKTTVLGAKF
jgi:hypothetical protein